MKKHFHLFILVLQGSVENLDLIKPFKNQKFTFVQVFEWE